MGVCTCTHKYNTCTHRVGGGVYDDARKKGSLSETSDLSVGVFTSCSGYCHTCFLLRWSSLAVSSYISWFSYVVTTPDRKQPKSREVYLGSWSEGIQTTVMRKSWHRDKWVLGGGQMAAACSVLSRNGKSEQGKLVQALQFLVFVPSGIPAHCMVPSSFMNTLR